MSFLKSWQFYIIFIEVRNFHSFILLINTCDFSCVTETPILQSKFAKWQLKQEEVPLIRSYSQKNGRMISFSKNHILEPGYPKPPRQIFKFGALRRLGLLWRGQLDQQQVPASHTRKTHMQAPGRQKVAHEVWDFWAVWGRLGATGDQPKDLRWWAPKKGGSGEPEPAWQQGPFILARIIMHVHTCAAINSTPFPFQDLNQYLILVDDAEEEEQEESVDRLFECLDTSSSESSSVSGGSGSGKKKKKGGKDKKDVKKVKKAREALAQKQFVRTLNFRLRTRKARKVVRRPRRPPKSKTEQEKNENEDPTEEEKRKQLGKDAKKAGYYAKVSSAHM